MFEPSPNKQKAKVMIEHNNKQALIGFSDKKKVDYESIVIVHQEGTPKLNDRRE